MKHLLPVAFMLLCMHVYAQHGVTYQDQQPPKATTPGLKNLIEEKDDMTGITMYYDPRTSIHSLKGSGIFAIIVKRTNDYVLKMFAYHVLQLQFGQTIPTPINATGVLIKTSDTLYAFENSNLIEGNGSNMTDIKIIGSTTDKNNFVYKLFSRIIRTGYCKLRFESTPQVDDYILSDREVSEIKNVVEAWLAVNHIDVNSQPQDVHNIDIQSHQNVNDVDDLISHSSNAPSDSLKMEYPDFSKICQYERNNDDVVKGIYFLNNNSNVPISISNYNMIFINQTAILKDNSLIEDKLITLLYRVEGCVHYLSIVKQNPGSGGIVNKELTMDKFTLNKAISLEDHCGVLKYVISDIKLRSMSNAVPIAEASSEIINMPLFQKYLNYANTCSPVDKPEDVFPIGF